MTKKKILEKVNKVIKNIKKHNYCWPYHNYFYAIQDSFDDDRYQSKAVMLKKIKVLKKILRYLNGNESIKTNFDKDFNKRQFNLVG